MNYFLHICVMLSIYGMLAYAMNLLTGFGGLLTLTQAAFYGMGAYVYALTTQHLGLTFFPAMLCAMTFCGIISQLLGVVILRFRKETFVLATLGFQAIVFAILYNWTTVTQGPDGISGIERPKLLGWTVVSVPEFLAFTAMLFMVVFIMLFIIYRSPFSLSLKALRDDEQAAQALGISPNRQFLQAMLVSSAITAIPGCCFAAYVTYIDPTSFTLQESIFIACILLVGGSGNLKGPACGVLFMLLLPETLRFIGFPNAVAGYLREIIYGTLLIWLMYSKPQGIAGAYAIK